MDYEQTVSFLEQIPRFGKEETLSSEKMLLELLGSPQERHHYIHVAGTNGKGTVCAILSRILTDAGFRTGLFTSPHLIRINERIRIDGKSISDEDFTAAFEAVMEKNGLPEMEGMPLPPYFGMLYAMAMWYFDKEKVDYIIAETGMGGRLDHTNLAAEPSLCVITSIGKDHTQYLGNTIMEIAAEKAGIIKPGVPVVFDANQPEAAGVIRKAAAEKNAHAVPVMRSMIKEILPEDKGIAFVLNNRYYDNVHVKVPFPAFYQADNFALGLTAARVLDPDRLLWTDDEAAASAARVDWPGRVQMIGDHLVVDGAHNPPAVEALCEWIAGISSERDLVLLTGLSADKDCDTIVSLLAQAAPWRAVVTTAFSGTRGMDPAVLAQMFKSRADTIVKAEADLSKALDLALEYAGGGIAVCTGSLYLAGNVLALTGTEIP